MRVLQAAVVQAARETSAELIHAHSPLVVGWPAAWAARSLGLPLVYEVRALWEDAAVDQGKTRPGSLRYRLTRALETRLLRRAEAVVTICDGLREEISARLGATGHVHVVQNGVDSAKFRPVAPQSFAVGPIGEGDPVLGYIGSLFRFEGVQVAVEAMRKIVQEVPRARLLVVGGGEMSAELAARVRELGLEGHVHMAGRVPHGEVERFYARSDVLIYPRISKRITEMVTPLKPLEAMAMGKPVLVSDVGGLKEIAPRGTAEWFRAGDPGDLAERAVGLLQDLARSRALGEAARGHVERERDWRKMAAGYLAVYEGALTRGA
jgi:PEP-CTERM/exosortase A-associated glycosyltransferase